MKPAKVLHQAGDNRTLGWQGRVDLRAPQLILPISATNNPIVFGRVWLLARLDKSLHDFDCTDAETLVSGWADFAWLDLPGSQAAHEQPFRSVPLVQHLKYFVGFGGAHRFECFFLSTLAQQYLPAPTRCARPSPSLPWLLWSSIRIGLLKPCFLGLAITLARCPARFSAVGGLVQLGSLLWDKNCAGSVWPILRRRGLCARLWGG